MTLSLSLLALVTALQLSTGVGTGFPGAATAIDMQAANRASEDAHGTIDTSRYDRDDEVSTEDVRNAAEALFRERFPEMAHRLDVRVVRIGSSVESPSALRARLNHTESIPRGHAQIRLSARHDDTWEDAGWALLYVAHFDSVAIAQNTVSRGDRVNRSDISFVWMETTKFRGDPLNPGAFRALTSDELYAESPLRAGEALRSNDLRPPYLAETGESITMTYSRGSLELKLTCQAREPGLRGDVIRAYSPDTKTTYKVILTGPGTASWKSTL